MTILNASRKLQRLDWLETRFLRIQMTACFHLQVLMRINFFGFNGVHPLGHSAIRPIEPLATCRGASTDAIWVEQAKGRCTGNLYYPATRNPKENHAP